MVKTTQNNWVPMMPLHDGGNRLYTKQDLDRVVADARKEVIEKVEKWTREGLADGNFEEIDRLKNLLDFLATLRKESK